MSKEVRITERPADWVKPPDQQWFIPTDERESVYRFIIAAARRARQLQAGARPTISTTSRKPTKIAMEEIRTGSIPVDLDPKDPEPIPEVDDTEE
jgi:DNA-directed RNA polymerase subunit omega